MEVVCNTCGILKKRIEDGKVGQQVAWKDENGKRWQRRRCPPCVKDVQMRYRKPKETGNDVVLIGSVRRHYVTRKTPLRKCDSCGAKSANYFKCPPCHALLVQSMGGDEGGNYVFLGGR